MSGEPTQVSVALERLGRESEISITETQYDGVVWLGFPCGVSLMVDVADARATEERAEKDVVEVEEGETV
jgi:hypothetical protein